MPIANDSDHFEDYREQTQVKHEILTAYLEAYLQIVGKTNKNLLYIDGFAGRGSYTKAATQETVDGSPIQTLKLIAGNPKLESKVLAFFIEANRELYGELEKAVTNFADSHPQIRKPVCIFGTFAEGINQILKDVTERLAPTFLFVDPCGISGESFEAIKSVMSYESCEAFIFLNVVGVLRTAGLGDGSNVLAELFGSSERARKFLTTLNATVAGSDREHLIIESYRGALHNAMGSSTQFHSASSVKAKK